MDSISDAPSAGQAGTASARAEPVISVRRLVKRYESHQAVAGIDLQVRRGEIFAFLGPNGAGKTTTVEILEGFRQRTAGEVAVLGQDPATADSECATGSAWSCRNQNPSRAYPCGSAWPCTPATTARRGTSTRPSPWSA